jgi:Fe-S-cluster containining protein
MGDQYSGIELLKRPLVPLTFLVSGLFLTTNLPGIAATVVKLKENITLDGVFYDNPQAILKDYLDVFEPYERFKRGELKTRERLIVDLDHKPLDILPGAILEIKQELLGRELGHINSVFCGQYHCTICCQGPLEEEENSFFELPLTEEEVSVFPLPSIDTTLTRGTTAYAEPPLMRNNQPFYKTGPALYRWRQGWGLILTRGSFCPNLNRDTGRCLIYEKRPEVCRWPQIFPMVLEKVFDPEGVQGIASANGVSIDDLTDKNHYYVSQEKILAVWDCPYVQEYKDEIIRFAELSSLDPVFRRNKK